MASSVPLPLAVQATQTRGSDDLPTERVLTGDRSAFDEIVTDHYQRVARLARRLLGWDEEVADVVQDVFVSVLENLPKFRGEAQLSTWLTTITVNTCRRHQRKRALRSKLSRLAMWQARNAETISAERRAVDRDTSHQLRRAVGQLPTRYREVVVLRYLEELPITEIAEILGTSRNVIDVRLTRARQRLAVGLARLAEETS